MTFFLSVQCLKAAQGVFCKGIRAHNFVRFQIFKFYKHATVNFIANAINDGVNSKTLLGFL